MPIRIIRACRSALGAIFLGLLVACAATDPAGPGDTGDAMLPEARLAAARLRLLAGYEEWERAQEACADLRAVTGLRVAGLNGMPDRRAA